MPREFQTDQLEMLQYRLYLGIQLPVDASFLSCRYINGENDPTMGRSIASKFNLCSKIIL